MAIYTRFGSEVKITKIIKTDPDNDGPVFLEFYRINDGDNSERFEANWDQFKATGGIKEILNTGAPIVTEY